MLKSGDRVCTVGAGYVGVVSSAWFARWNPDIQFVVVDKDAERVKSWTSDGTLPIREPGLSSLIPQSNLSFSSEVAKEVAQAGWIFIAVSTPSRSSWKEMLTIAKPHDLDLDLSCLYEALDLIARVCTHEHTVVIRSTVPPGTAEKATAFVSSVRITNLSLHLPRLTWYHCSSSKMEMVASQSSPTPNFWHKAQLLSTSTSQTALSSAVFLMMRIIEMKPRPWSHFTDANQS